MRGYIKIASCLLALSMLVGCGKENSNKMDGVTIKLDGFDLDNAKAMAHLKTEGAETKASIGFGQTDALYLVYDGNEIRLPDIQFSVEVPDNMSNWEKKQLLKDIHISVGTPEIKDCGNYIFVKASLSYYTTFNGGLEHGIISTGGGNSMGAIAYYLVRKEDGQIFDITEDVSKELGPLKFYNNMVMDSNGNYYMITTAGNGAAAAVHRLYKTETGFEIKTVNVGLSDIDWSAAWNDLHYVLPLEQRGPVVIGEDGKVYTVSSSRGINAEEEYMVLGIVSPDLTCEKVRIDGTLLGFHKSGNELLLFVIDKSTFKLYDATDGCKLVSSVTKEGYDERFIEGFQEVGHKDGVYSYYGADLIVRFDVNSGECTVLEVNETICNYLSYHNNAHAKAYCGGKFYVAYSPDEENYVEVLKLDVMAETVEKLRRLDGPEGCFFSGGIMIEDESEGKLLITGTFIRKDDGMIVEEVNQQIIVPEIAQAYAEANAVEYYGIDFGTYKVVNVVPLTDDLDSSEN